jgi:hypothetical protein
MIWVKGAVWVHRRKRTKPATKVKGIGAAARSVGHGGRRNRRLCSGAATGD